MKILTLLLAATAAFAQTAVFPPAVATNNDLSVARNLVATTLTVAISATATSFTVADATGIVANEMVTIGTEIIWVCGVSGKTITVGKSTCPNVDGRGFDTANGGGAAAVHTSGSAVKAFVTAWNVNAAYAEIKAIETALGVNLSNVTFPSATALQQFRRNAANTANVGFTSPIINAADYNFTTLSPTTPATLVSGNNSVTFPLVPLGMNGTDAAHYVWVAGTGTPEACLINGGAGTAGQTNGAIIINCAGAHSAGYTIASANGGRSEAAQAIGSGGGTIIETPATTIFRATLTFPYSNTTFFCQGGSGGCIWQALAGNTYHNMVYAANRADITLDGITLDSNLINTSATYQRGIEADTVTNLTLRNGNIINTGYTGAPAYDGTMYANSAGIKCTACTNARIYNMRFWSNWVQDIVGTGNSPSIHNNQHGTPNLSDVGTGTNYWDTHAGGIASVDWANSNGVSIVDNTIWGTNRFYTPSFAEGNPIVVFKLTNSIIDSNTITGMTPLPGTCSVTATSTAVTCTRPIFSSTFDVGAGFECETKVGTIYRISAVGSTTTATLGSAYGGTTLATARCRMQIAGDGIQTNGLINSRVTRNSVTRSADMGIDVNMYWDGVPADNVGAAGNVVSQNVVTDSMACGINLALGLVNYSNFSGNIVKDNHRGTNTNPGARGGFCLSPTPDNVLYYVQSLNNFNGNSCIDSTSTQNYCFDVDTTSFSGGYIGLNQFSGNLYTGGTAFSNVPIPQSMPQTTALPGGVAAGFLTSSVPVNTDATAGLITYTAAQMVNAMLARGPGGAVNDVTPTAAQIMAYLGNGQAVFQTAFNFYLRNNASGANTVTVTGGTGVTISGTATIAQNFQRTFLCQVTNAAVGSEAVTCYSMGTIAY